MIGFCSRLEPPKKFQLGVNIHNPPATSIVQRPFGFDSPSSGLKAQRFEPSVTRRRGSYWPVGAMKNEPDVQHRADYKNRGDVLNGASKKLKHSCLLALGSYDLVCRLTTGLLVEYC
jgi:hypothetical protein